MWRTLSKRQQLVYFHHNDHSHHQYDIITHRRINKGQIVVNLRIHQVDGKYRAKPQANQITSLLLYSSLPKWLFGWLPLTIWSLHTFLIWSNQHKKLMHFLYLSSGFSFISLVCEGKYIAIIWTLYLLKIWMYLIMLYPIDLFQN